ncbi:baseplate assembly protein [Acuticoccus sediminis]|uniref:Baseplate assembly protein n=1 Tax=Acuticoccus sediminis TaxID=2184697 RepID=A0A8B2NVK9_9HYPH|nr:baseplate assembly protein [Acuticoccus sediminis]
MEDVIGFILWKIADDERRNRNRNRIGTIDEVDAEKGLARVKLTEGGDYEPLRTPWLPWREQAMGAARTHFPPSVGQQVRVVSENGDLTEAEIELSIPQTSIERPSKSGEEFVLLDVGGTKIVATGDGITITTGSIAFKAEKWVATAPSFDWFPE